MRRFMALVGASLVCLTGSGARADVTLRRIFSDNMVLQQGVAVPVFGTAANGERVTVTFAGQTVSATAADGKWLVKLQPLKAGGPFEMTVEGNNKLTLKNVLVGEVWIASGQSNMGFTLRGAKTGPEAIAASDNPNLRLFSVPNVPSSTPLADLKGGAWVQASPKTTPNFTAVGYFFARDLQKALGVPVGIINSSWGGTFAEAWTNRAALEGNADLKVILDDYAKSMERYRTTMLPQWQQKADAAKAAGQTPPKKPNDPAGDRGQHEPGALYNGMIEPLEPFAIKGAVWYQGENNGNRGYQYRKLLPAMIQSWRDAFGCGDFGFFIVQLAPFNAIVKQPGASDWAEVREAQFLATKALPNVGCVAINDVGNETNIHPTDKEPVGARLALQAEGKTYGMKVVSDGPTYRDMKVEGAAIRLSFDHTDGGLVCKGDALTGFAIAGADKKFYNAEAKIDGTSIVVSSADVAAPVAVRFGWAQYPVVNLWNGAGLPAYPFRTDDWPGRSWPKQP
jgi:sialate O-acetylesterase